MFFRRHKIGIFICILLFFSVFGLSFGIYSVYSNTKSYETLPNKKNIITSGLVYKISSDTQLYDKPEGGSVLAQIPKDSEVQILALAENGCYKVSYGDAKGFVSGDYVIDEELIKELKEKQKVGMYVVNVDKYAKMYEKPDRNTTVIANVNKGTRVTAVNGVSQNGMIEVENNNMTGYIESKYLSRSAPAE